MKTFIVSPILDKSDMWFLADDNLIYHIKEGTGDNLMQEDIDDGYVDYIYIDIYENSLSNILEDYSSDGGMILLKKLYQDMSIEEILGEVEQFYDIKFFSMEDEEWVRIHEQVTGGLEKA